MKLDKRLYEKVLIERIFRQRDINFPDELTAAPWQKSLQRAKEKVKPLVPRSITSRLIDLKSPVAYDLITDILKKDAGPGAFSPPRQDNIYNSYIVQWYLHRTRELLKKS